MLRQIVLDTETTGTEVQQGDRVIELGCVELINREPTGNNLHLYFNPDGRDSDPGALRVHGLTTEFLSDYELFKVHAQEVADYLRGAELIIHNAPFDVGFLDAEFARCKMPPISEITHKVTDSLVLARSKFPGQRNSLDALCSRFQISNEHRVLHGALLDAELLAEVWLAMTREQFGLLDNIFDETSAAKVSSTTELNAAAEAIDLAIIQADEEELREHEAYVEVLDTAVGGESLWRRYQ